MTPAQVKPTISPELLNQIDIIVGIESVSDVDNSEKLVALRVNFGDHVRTVLAGMKRERANPREIEGKQALFARPATGGWARELDPDPMRVSAKEASSGRVMPTPACVSLSPISPANFKSAASAATFE